MDEACLVLLFLLWLLSFKNKIYYIESFTCPLLSCIRYFDTTVKTGFYKQNYIKTYVV